MLEFGRRGACEAVVRISEKTLNHKGSLSSGMGHAGENKYSVLVNVERKVCFSLVL